VPPAAGPDLRDTGDPAAVRPRRAALAWIEASSYRSSPWLYLGKVLAVAVAYYVAARLGLRFAVVERNVTPLWPPSGIAVVALLVLGRSVWPGIALAAFLVNLPISANPLAAATTAVGNTLAPLLASVLLVRVGFHRRIDRQRDALAVVFLGALLSMLVSASIGAGTLVWWGGISGHRFVAAWAAWWTGDAMGVLVVTPFLLSLGTASDPARMSRARTVEAVVSFGILVPASIGVMHSHLHLLFLLIPLVGWAAWRFQLEGAAPAALFVVGLASWSAARGWGPFATGTLFSKMLTLQAFNATVALVSLLFATLVSERVRARAALEQAARELDARVRRRTAELSAANERLRQEAEEREEAQRRLRDHQRQLVEAQRVAGIGSWEWLIPDNRVHWSDEMYRIHGHAPQSFEVTFEQAVAQVVDDDVERIRANVEAGLRAGRDLDFPDNEYRIVRPDGEERVLLGKAKLETGPGGEPLRMLGTVQDITETKRAEREHRIAETLQRSLLPDRLPEIPGVRFAARYAPASADMEVGGDWYDVIQLPNGKVGLAIGDVAGHGLRAAAIMGQLRMALRAYGLEEESPAAAVARVDQLVHRLPLPEMATVLYGVFDPDSGGLRFANAGHPPPLLIEHGSAAYVEEGLAPPLGVASVVAGFPESELQLAPGATLLLFTDGLVERRGVSILDGLARLKTEALRGEGGDLDALCDDLLRELVGPGASDDVALLALRPTALSGQPLRQRLPAEPSVLAPLRRAMRRWLRELDADPEVVEAILVACGEACTNAIQHAYGAREGFLEIEFSHAGGTVEMAVRDAGAWRPPTGAEGGRGIPLMQGLMDAVEVESSPGGTVVRMRKRIRSEA